jgi:hypothetical protein
MSVFLAQADGSVVTGVTERNKESTGGQRNRAKEERGHVDRFAVCCMCVCVRVC